MNPEKRKIDTSRIDRELTERLPQYIARRHQIVPLFGSDNHVVVAATGDKADPRRLREIGEQIGVSIVAYDFEQYSSEEIDEAIEGLYGGQHMRIGELLMLDGVLTERQLDEALERQAQVPERKLGDILEDLGYVEESKVQAAYARQVGYRFLSINAALFLDLSLVSVLPRELITRRRILPVPKSENADEVYLLVSEKISDEFVEEVRQYLGSSTIEPLMASPAELDEAIEGCLRRLGYMEVRDRLLGQYLIDRRILTREQLEEALHEQKSMSLKLGELLVSNGSVTERVMVEVIAQQLGVDYMLVLPDIIPDEFKDMLTERFARSNKVMPIAYEGNALLVAMADPQEKSLISLLHQMFKREIKPVLAVERVILQAIERYYSSCANGLTVEKPETDTQAGKHAEVDSDDAERIAGIVGGILADGVQREASDIQLTPKEGGIELAYRIDGELAAVAELPEEDREALADRIKSMAGMRAEECRVPQNGRISERIADRRVDFRVSTLPTRYGENIVMRVLDCGRLLENDLGRLGMPPEVRGMLLERCEKRQGIILVAGPAGCGKTTTLYNLINWLHEKKPGRAISTAEDTVGCDVDGIVQTEVSREDGLSMASILREKLRRNSDVIVVDEMRSAEEGSLVLEAALGGRMVIGALNSGDGALAVRRLLDMGLEPRDISTTLSCVLSQRLVKRLCHRCAEDYVPSEAEVATVRGTVPGFEPGRHNLKIAKGCEACNEGYRGFVGLFELLLIDPGIRQLLSVGSDDSEIREAAVRNGMKTLRLAGYELALRGMTTLNEVFRVVEDDDSL